MDTDIGAATMLPDKPATLDAAAQRNRSTERARECRRRKKDGLRLIPVEIFEQEIAELVQLGLLPASEQSDRNATAYALYPVIEAGLTAIKSAKPAVRKA